MDPVGNLRPGGLDRSDPKRFARPEVQLQINQISVSAAPHPFFLAKELASNEQVTFDPLHTELTYEGDDAPPQLADRAEAPAEPRLEAPRPEPKDPIDELLDSLSIIAESTLEDRTTLQCRMQQQRVREEPQQRWVAAKPTPPSSGTGDRTLSIRQQSGENHW